jgi:hypothetical protein
MYYDIDGRELVNFCNGSSLSSSPLTRSCTSVGMGCLDFCNVDKCCFQSPHHLLSQKHVTHTPY